MWSPCKETGQYRKGELAITRHLRLKCLTLKIKNFKFASNLRENF